MFQSHSLNFGPLARPMRIIAAAALISAVFEGPPLGIAAFAAEETVAADPAPLVHTSPAARFHVGDRLQITFFEHLEIPQPTDLDGAGAPMRTFYQRLDLTGEYHVEVDGDIAIPLLGRFEVKGKSLEDLRSDIATAFERETSRSGEVHVAILERRPVFVMGLVRNPGAYGFAPGMIALQAIALAGGYERLPEGATQYLDAKRERERLAQAVQRLKRLTAQKARLLEERDGKRVAATHPMLARASHDAGELLEGERRLLEVEAALREGESDLHTATVGSARDELVALRDSIELVDQQIVAREERLQVIQQMQGRGITNLEAVWSAQKEVTELELQRKQFLSAIYTAEQKVAQSNQTKSRIELEYRARIARELVAVEDEIAGLETTIATAEDMARSLEAAAAARGIGPQDVVKIEVLRRTHEGATALEATESTELIPGDVVKVVVERSEIVSSVRPDRP